MGLGKMNDKRNRWRGEVCKRCGREQRIAWSTSDGLWRRVTNGSLKVWCLECFLKVADEKNIEVQRDDITIWGFVFSWFKGAKGVS